MPRGTQAARLLSAGKSGAGQRLLILGRGDTTVGSSSASTLAISDPNIAERHALIVYARGRYHLADLGSESGTFVNGSRLRGTRALKQGDQIRFGPGISYRFIDPDGSRRRANRIRFNLAAGAVIVLLAALFVHYKGWDSSALGHGSSPPVLPAGVSSTAAMPRNAGSAVPSRAASISSPQASVATAPSNAQSAKAAAAAAAPSGEATVGVGEAKAALARINVYRTQAKLTPLADDVMTSSAAEWHSKYLLINFLEAIRKADPLSNHAHGEDPLLSGYTKAGAEIAPNSQLGWGCNTGAVCVQIDNWIAGPFHRLDLLDPNLASAGFGEATRDGCWAAALRLNVGSDALKPYTSAIEYPPDGAVLALRWIGVESPDPLASCQDYGRPVGFPITLQLGRLANTRLVKEALLENGKPIANCAFDSHTYTNPIGAEQEWGRWSLRNSGGVIIVPRQPLVVGALYAVSITTQNRTYDWSFRQGDLPAGVPTQ